MAKQTASTRPGRGADQFIVRMPDGMRDRIAALARVNGRSMNAEIVAALERYIQDEDSIPMLWDRIEKLESMVRDHDAQLNPRKYSDFK
jgi:predicted DNA-binding protein